MATPTNKSAGIEAALDHFFGNDKSRRASIEADVCAQCNGPAHTFNDALSRKEYRISGLCQTCQDRVFDDGEPE